MMLGALAAVFAISGAVAETKSAVVSRVAAPAVAVAPVAAHTIQRVSSKNELPMRTKGECEQYKNELVNGISKSAGSFETDCVLNEETGGYLVRIQTNNPNFVSEMEMGQETGRLPRWLVVLLEIVKEIMVILL